MVKDILKLIPVMQSASILEDNIEFSDISNKKSKDFVKQGLKNVVGISLLKTTSNLIDFD